MMNEPTQTLVNTLIEMGALIITTVITVVVLPYIKQWLTTKVKDEKYRTAISEVFEQVNISVNYIEQTVVNQLKKDGKWNTETQKDALNKAIDSVLASLSDSTIDYLKSNMDDVPKYIATQIESAIISNKDKN